MSLVTISTSAGDIHLELDAENAPITVANFLQLAKDGYYNGTIFHRIIDGFMVQGGGLDENMAPKPTGTEPIQNEANNGLKNDRGTIWQWLELWILIQLQVSFLLIIKIMIFLIILLKPLKAGVMLFLAR